MQIRQPQMAQVCEQSSVRIDSDRRGSGSATIGNLGSEQCHPYAACLELYDDPRRGVANADRVRVNAPALASANRKFSQETRSHTYVESADDAGKCTADRSVPRRARSSQRSRGIAIRGKSGRIVGRDRRERSRRVFRLTLRHPADRICARLRSCHCHATAAEGPKQRGREPSFRWPKA